MNASVTDLLIVFGCLVLFQPQTTLSLIGLKTLGMCREEIPNIEIKILK